MEQLHKIFAFGRRIAEAIADGRLEASRVEDMTDEQLAEFDSEVYQALLDAQAENEALANEVIPENEATE